MGDPNQRRIDDREAHRNAARISSGQSITRAVPPRPPRCRKAPYPSGRARNYESLESRLAGGARPVLVLERANKLSPVKFGGIIPDDATVFPAPNVGSGLDGC